MANGGSIKYSIGFNTDKAGLNQLKTTLQELQKMSHLDMKANGIQMIDSELENLKRDAQVLEGALERAFNQDLGTLNVAKFNQELKKSGTDLNTIYQSFSKAGAAGQSAFRNTTAQILTTNMQLKQTHRLLDDMATTMANTIKWGVASSIMNNFTGSVQQAYGYVKSLDGSLNDIRIVTEMTADEMDRFAVKANNAAKALGQTTTSYTDAALIYYQQGLSESDVEARAEATLKAANVTGQAGDKVSEQLTAVWNGYKVEAAEAELYVDKLAAVAATTASDLEELSVGMSKVASAANIMGVDVDQLNATLATVVSVTRQAPESVGTAFKTIYARMGDIKAGLDSETTLGEFTAKIKEISGVSVLDTNNQLRDMGEVIEEVGNMWGTLSREQQIALSQTMAGTRQYNNLLSLFDNWDMYTDAMETSANAAGTLQKQQDIYMESTAAHLNSLKAASEDLYDSLLDEDAIISVADGLTGITELASNFVDSIGGGLGVLAMLGTLGIKVFQRQIAGGIVTAIQNLQAFKENAIKINAEKALVQQLGSIDLQDKRTKELVGMKERILALDKSITNEERNIANEYIRQKNELFNQQDSLKNRLDSAQEAYGRLTGESNLALNQKTNLINENELKSAQSVLKAIDEQLNFQLVSVNDTQRAWTSYARATADRQTSEALANVTNQYEQMTNAAREFLRLGQLDGRSQEYQELNQALIVLNNTLGENGTLNMENELHVAALHEVLGTFRGALQRTRQDVKMSSDAFGRHNQEVQANSNAIQNATGAFRQFAEAVELKNKIQGLIGFAGQLSQIGFSLQSLINLTNVWNNDSLSAGEKVLQTLTSISMILPGILAAYKVWNGLLVAFEGIQSVITVARNKELADKVKDIVLMGQQNKLTKEQIALQLALANAQAQGKFKWADPNTFFNNKSDKVKKSFLDRFGMNKATVEATNLNIGFSNLMSKEVALLGTTAKLGTVLSSLAITLGIVAGATFIAVKIANKEEDALAAAQEQAEKSQAAYQKVAESVSSINNALDKLVSERKTLDEMTEGTAEWTIKVQELNAEILKLIEMYPELMKFTSINDKGIMEISEEGSEYLKKEQANRLSAANNIYLNDRKNVLKAQQDLYRSEYQDNYTFTNDSIYRVFADNGASEFAEDQESPINFNKDLAFENLNAMYSQIGEQLFTEAGANLAMEALTPAAQWNDELQDKIYQNILDNRKLIEDMSLADIEMQQIEESQLTSKTSALGSTRSADELKELLNIESYSDITAASREKVANDFGDWNTTIDYKESDSEWKAINDFMKLQGDNVEYVGQSWGKVVLEIDGKEEKFSKTQVYDALAEYYSGDELEARLGEALTTSLNEALNLTGEMSLNSQSIPVENLIKLDEFKRGLETALEDTDISDSINTIFNSLYEAGGSTPEGLIELSEQFSYLNFEDAEVLRAIKNEAISLQEGNGSIESFTGALNKLNEEAKLESMDSYFSDMANSLNMDEDAAGAMQEYAKHIMNISEESEIFSSELATNADSAADLSVEIARMNQGIEKLAENFDDWSSILEKSTEESMEYFEAMSEVKNALGDVLDVESDLISNDFVTAHFEEIKKAADGDADAIDALRASMDEELIANISIGQTEEFQARLQELDAEVKAALPDREVKIGAILEDEAFLDAANKLVEESSMTADEANAYFAGIGYEPVYSQEEIDNSAEVPNAKTTMSVVSTGWSEAKVDLGPLGTHTMNLPSLTYKTESVPEDPTNAPANTRLVSFSGEKTPPKIRGMRKKATGSTNNYSSSNKGGSPAKKSSGSGGGGSKSKPKTEKKVETKKDRYHDVNVKLGQTSQELEDLSEEQDKLFGKDLLNNLNKEVELLQKQKDLYAEKLAIAKEEQAELRETLSLNGVEFNADGTLSNYFAVLEAKEAALDAMINHYNSLSAEEQETYQETLDKAKEDYDKFLEDLSRYEEITNEEINDIEEAIQDAIDRQIEINIKKLNMEVELRLDLTEAQKDWNEFKRNVIDDIGDDILKGAMADVELLGTMFANGTMSALTNNINTTLTEIEKMNRGEDNLFGNDKQSALDNLKTQQKELMSYLEEIADIQDQINDAYLDMIDEVSETYQDQIESFEYINELINHSINLVKLLNGEDSYSDLIDLYKAQEQNNLQNIAAQRQRVEYFKAMMEAETDDEARKQWEEKWKESVSDFNSMLEESIELIQESYKNTINAIFDELNDKLTEGKGLDYINLEWELRNENADAYLDTINRIYEVQKLEREVIKSINDTDSVYAQKELNKFLDEELKKLREKDKLTQYDVDRANQLYEIKLKEIALEEAQKNKSQMRLRRDASGNYSYQFVADQDSIAQAQQGLDDARNSLYNMDKDEYQNNQQALLDIYTEFQEKMREAADLSAEERALIEQEYTERINGLLNENAVIRENLQASAIDSLIGLNQMSSEILLEEILPNWDSGVQSMIDKMTAEGGFGPSCEEAMTQLQTATDDYNISLATLESTAGVSFEAVTSGQTGAIVLAEDLAIAQQENIDKTKDELNAIKDLKIEVDNLKASYEALNQAALTALTNAQKLLEQEYGTGAGGAGGGVSTNTSGSSGSGASANTTGDNGSGGSATSAPSEPSEGSRVTFTKGQYYYDSDGTAPSGSKNLGKEVYVTRIKKGKKKPYHISTGATLGQGDLGWLTKEQLKFDTGGYTGDWVGNEGKMAILHKKELILNEGDTKNFLSALNVMKNMESWISALNDSMISRVSGMTSNLTSSSGFENELLQDLNQHVEIQASFPGVSERSVVEEAFENLINKASQHAFRNQR